MKRKAIWGISAKMIVVAITATLTALRTTSCMGHGLLYF